MTSIVAWMTHVDSDSHCENMSARTWRESFALRSRGGIFRFRAVVIFATFSEFLVDTESMRRRTHENIRIEEDTIIDRPQILQYKLNE